jgi:hypothetical protein
MDVLPLVHILIADLEHIVLPARAFWTENTNTYGTHNDIVAGAMTNAAYAHMWTMLHQEHFRLDIYEELLQLASNEKNDLDTKGTASYKAPDRYGREGEESSSSCVTTPDTIYDAKERPL